MLNYLKDLVDTKSVAFSNNNIHATDHKIHSSLWLYA